MKRFHVDFNTRYDEGKILIAYPTLERHQERIKELVPGMRVLLYTSDLQVEAIVEFDECYQWWAGIPDDDTWQDVDSKSEDD